MIEITLNDTPHAVKDGSDLAELVQTLGYAGKRIAVERNGEIVPKSRYVETPLAAGDRLEIVVAVGGG
ncbi:MAG: sulfur carrier protein ThiS [Lautropia sp.]|nr:sulfur carrier protein ThiS [Lautropia sp.]